MENQKSYWSNPCIMYAIQDNESKAAGVIADVCEVYNVTLEVLKGKSRLSKIVEARQVCHYILHRKMGIKCTAVGKMFNKDHATVLHSAAKIQMFMEYEDDLRKRVSFLVAKHDFSHTETKVKTTEEIMNKYN